MNSLCRPFVAAFLALILILPHPAFALRETQEDPPIHAALERRLHSAAGLEETGPVKVLYKNLDISFEDLLAVSRKHGVRTFMLYRDKDMRDPSLGRFGRPGNPPPAWDMTDLIEKDLLSAFGEWARDMRYYVLITEHPTLAGKIWAEIVPVESTGGLEEETDWTLHWDTGRALADEKDAFILEKEPWRDFFESLRARSPNARVLDIGSGNMAVSLFAQGIWSGFDLRAIDRADIHPEQFPQSDKIQFRRANVEQSGYPDKSFDAVTGRYALEYTKTDRSFLELARILQPGGRGLFLLHHRDSTFVRNARLLTVDGGVLPAALDAYERSAAYLQDRTGENLQQRANAIGRLLEYRDAAEPKVQQEASTAYDNILILLASPNDEFQTPLDILGNYIRETRFIVNAHRDLVKAALSPEDVPEWTRRFTEAGLVVDRFEPFYQDDVPAGWILKIHKPTAVTGLEENEEGIFDGAIGSKDISDLAELYQSSVESAREKAVEDLHAAATKIQQDLFNRLWERAPSLLRLVDGKAVRAIRVQLTDDPWIIDMVEGDANEIEYLFGLLRHIVANSIDSAVLRWEPNFDPLEIQLRAFTQGEKLVIQALDNGTGFSKETLQRIGDPGFTTRSQTKGVHGRSGLGVFFSSVIAKQLGWELTFENRADIQGAVVTVRIPLATAGLEETYAERVRAQVRKEISAVIAFSRRISHFIGYDATTKRPRSALVRGRKIGDEYEWWVHLHLEPNGFLFRLMISEGKIVGVTDPMGEPVPDEFSAEKLEGFAFLQGLIDPKDVAWLVEKAQQKILSTASDLEAGIRDNNPRFVLARAIDPGSTALFQMATVRSTWPDQFDEHGVYTSQWGGRRYQRMDLLGSGLEERTARSVTLLRQVPPAVPGSVGEAVLVFRDPATFDLAALAVRYGRSIAVLDDSLEADALKELLDALPGPKGRYAVGFLESSRFLEGYDSQIYMDNREEAFRQLGLRWNDLPPPVSAALESVLAYLDRAVEA